LHLLIFCDYTHFLFNPQNDTIAKKVTNMQNSYKRVDAHLSNLGYCTRSEAKKFLSKNVVSINGVRVFDVREKAHHSDITVDGEKLDDETLVLLMHKPSGVVCSHSDGGVLIYSLLPQRWQRRKPKNSNHRQA